MPPKTPAKTADKADGEGGKATPTRFGVEDQFKFLISCIRHSDNGKINFGEVAIECESVSKGAAAKRYERLMKTHGIHHSSSSTTPRDVSLKSTPRKAAKPKTPKGKVANKKRKMDEETSSDEDYKIGEDSSPVKKEEEHDIPSSPSPVKHEEDEAEIKGFTPVNGHSEA